MSARIDLKGKKYGVLEVLEFDTVFQTHAKWKCLCHNCYDITSVPSAYVMRDDRKTCSKCRGSRLSYKEGLDIIDGLKNGLTKTHFRKKYKCSYSVLMSAIKYAKQYLDYNKDKD
jgi:hypothetical protein